MYINVINKHSFSLYLNFLISYLGIFQLGPAPLRAVKEGNVNMRYDVRFVFAEVNADVVYWARPAPNREFSPVNVNRTLIGEFFINFAFFHLSIVSK